MSKSSPALEGLRVLDVTQVMAGPYCAMLLADLGADVIKVEPPAGDSTRQMPGARGTDSPSFNAVNRGKRSLVLNLKTPEGRGVFARLARSSDIVIENYRPGVMASLGLDYPALSAANPRLIYASISGYGQTGPYRGMGGFDLIAQGVAGIMSITGEPGGAPVKAGIPVTDLAPACSRWSAFSRRSSIAIAPASASTSTRRSWTPASRCRCGRRRSISPASACRPALGSAHRMNAPYQAIRCADGYITLGAANERLFRRLCEVLGHTEWGDDPAFADNASRVEESRRARGADRSDHRRAAAPALAGAVSGERHPVRADQRLRAGVRGSPGRRARDGRRDRSSDARVICARSARRSR